MSCNKVLMPLSHGILAIIGMACLNNLQNVDLIWLQISYTVICINNVFGMMWYLSEFDAKIRKIYDFTAHCQLLYALPGITLYLLLQNGYSDRWTWLLVILPTFLLFCYIIQVDIDFPFAELLILFNLVALGAVSFIKNIHDGVSATFAYAVSHYFFQNAEMRYAPFYNYGLCVFAYFSFLAVISNNRTY